MAGVKKKKKSNGWGTVLMEKKMGNGGVKNVGSEMVGGPWLSGSGRGKSKDPGG